MLVSENKDGCLIESQVSVMGAAIFGVDHITGSLNPGGVPDKLWSVIDNLPNIVMEALIVEHKDPLMLPNELCKLIFCQQVLVLVQL